MEKKYISYFILAEGGRSESKLFGSGSVCTTLENWKRRRLIKEKYINSVGIRERTERVGHGRKRKKKGGKQRKDLHTDKESEREREKDLRPRASSQHVMKVRFFRRCNLHRFRFRSLWQNVGPPALQLMRATSKTPESGEDRKPGERRDLRPKNKKKKAVLLWESDNSSVFGWTCVCLSLEGFRRFKAAVTGDESIGGCQCFNCGETLVLPSSECLRLPFYSFFFFFGFSILRCCAFKGQIREEIKGF